MVLAIPACGPGEFFHDVHPATGIVTIKGQPLAGALVLFRPVDSTLLSIPDGQHGPVPLDPSGTTEADGTFALSTYYADDGAPAGAYKVTVLWGPLAPSVEDGGSPRPVPRGRSRPGLDPKYSDAASTPLEATITPGGPNRFTFEVD